MWYPSRKNVNYALSTLVDQSRANIDNRYGRASTMLISQFPIDTWHTRFPDPTLADAILDRLIHNAHRINLTGDSQRKLRAEMALSST
jgi:DNA replication protein DnaC